MSRSLRWRTIMSYILFDTLWSIIVIGFAIGFGFIDKNKFTDITLQSWLSFSGNYLLVIGYSVLIGLLFLSLGGKIALRRLEKNNIQN